MSLRKLINIVAGNTSENEQEEPAVQIDIYDILRVLDKYKGSPELRKIYKTYFDYDRVGNSVSFIFKIENFHKFHDFESVMSSEYMRQLEAELKGLHLSDRFLQKFKNKGSYKLNLFGSTGIYQSPFIRIRL